DDRARVIAQREQLLAEDAPSDIEYRVVWPDGSVHVIFGRARVIRDEGGRPVRVVGTNVDVTEQRRAEEQLARRARQQAAVAEVGLRALRGGDLQELLDEAAALVASTFAVEYCMVMEVTPDGSALVLRAGAGPWHEGAKGHAKVSAESGFMGFFAMN